MGMGFAPTWLRQVSPPASQNHFNHWSVRCCRVSYVINLSVYEQSCILSSWLKHI